MQANMRKSGLQNAEDELSRYTNKNGEKGVISSTKNTSSSVPLTDSITKKTEAVNPSVPVVASGTSSKPLATSGVNPTYQGNDFLQWYKKNFGTDYDTTSNNGWSRPEGMADIDYEIGSKLYNSYLSNKLLEDNYGSHKDELQGQYNDSIAALDANKNTAMQQADVLHQRVEKYLPTQLKAQGLGGLGIGQQMQLDAYNDYASNIGKINSEYNANRTDLDSSHNSALAELERGYLTSKAENDLAAWDKVDQAIKDYQDKLSEEQNDLYNAALVYIEDRPWNNIDELENYINTFEGKVKDWQWNDLQQYLEDVKSSDDVQDLEEEKKEQEALDNYYTLTQKDVTFNNNGGWWIFGSTDFREGDNFSVIDSEGRKYRIESGGEETDEEVIKAAINVANNTVFGCAEKLYIKKDGHIYEIQNRELGTKTKDYEDLYKRIFG